MKNMKSRGRRPAAKAMRTRAAKGTKTPKAPGNFAEYLAGVPAASRGALRKMRAAIRSAVPAGATETISYQIPAFRRGAILVWFGAFAKHLSLFPTAAVIEALGNEVKGYATSKGTIQFPVDKPMPAALIRKIVKARVAQVKSKEGVS